MPENGGSSEPHFPGTARAGRAATPTWPLVPPCANAASHQTDVNNPSTQRSHFPTIPSTIVGQPTRNHPHLVVRWSKVPPDVVVLGLTADTAVIQLSVLENTAHSRRRNAAGGRPSTPTGTAKPGGAGSQQPPEVEETDPTWPAAPPRPRPPDENGHNGNGHNGNGNGNGHGNGTKGAKHTGYLQLKEGEKPTWQGLTIERRYTRPGVHPYDTVEWDLREAAITNEHGKVVFEQKDLEFPKAWSHSPPTCVASKYFRGHAGHAGARALGQADDRPGRRHHHATGASRTPTSRPMRTRTPSATS